MKASSYSDHNSPVFNNAQNKMASGRAQPTLISATLPMWLRLDHEHYICCSTVTLCKMCYTGLHAGCYGLVCCTLGLARLQDAVAI